MKIENSEVSLAAASSQTTLVVKSEELHIWTRNRQIQAEAGSKEGDYTLSLSSLSPSIQGSSREETVFELPGEDQTKIDMIRRMIERLTGKKLQFYVPVKLVKVSDGDVRQTSRAAPARIGWGIDYRQTEIRTESASMSFSAKGTVKTADGREVMFSMDMGVSRNLISSKSFSFRAGDALVDPLVVNYAGNATELSRQKFSFDLDNDGREDSVPFLKKGSGFLVFDKNGDGIINDGSELFGPSAGSGFLELSKYDADENGWIDENDPIYDKLQIWIKNEEGTDELFAVGQMGIGAIYVKGIQSAYALKEDQNATLGSIRQTGIFLWENGMAGTIQHVDMSI